MFFCKVIGVKIAVHHGTSAFYPMVPSQVIEEHKCKPLQGLHICVTNIEEATRHKISRQTHDNGGTYCGELKKDSCTHLIVGSGKTAGSVKYKFAKQWGIHCVTLQVGLSLQHTGGRGNSLSFGTYLAWSL